MLHRRFAPRHPLLTWLADLALVSARDMEICFFLVVDKIELSVKLLLLMLLLVLTVEFSVSLRKVSCELRSFSLVFSLRAALACDERSESQRRRCVCR